MITLSHGYLKPQNGVDAGSAWFPAMETNIQKLNDHTHNLSDGNQIAVTTQSILAVDWVDQGGGLFAQDVTMPAGFLYDVTDLFFRLSTGEIWYPSVVRLSATSFRIFINDNTLNALVYYR